jgi:hypothetical protein
MWKHFYYKCFSNLFYVVITLNNKWMNNKLVGRVKCALV